ncbi:MAG TPA: sulfatase-like hydrolase/transferase [Phycisphaerae bacterium]|nr:sulfatase-like hydrolase/transferase [Phycisphaerae bacterium]HQL73646.1 sulfatase-like hydrolase/transferase [Phycisphaerae bacterium]
MNEQGQGSGRGRVSAAGSAWGESSGPTTRRAFLRGAACAAAGASMAGGARAATAAARAGAEVAGGGAGQTRPNVLWITCEDLSPWLGCYGYPDAVTPNLDALARRGVRYTAAFATAPVCSPSRSCLILGAYATTTGTEQMRTRYPLAERFAGFPSYLRQGGYYCTNNSKTDYNTAAEPRIVKQSWDQCGRKAHWRGRKAGQPFFAVFNFTCTHQSTGGFIDPSAYDRKPLASGQHDPAKVVVPPYYPDTPVIRRTLAHYHDMVTRLDGQVGDILAQLEADGVAEDTIVFFYADHGTGLPRGKRTLYDSGLLVPLIVYVPPKFKSLAPAKPGEALDRLVSFVDFGPTVLSLVGIDTPPQMQGQAFMGPHERPARRFVVGCRDRIAEEVHMSRCIRDKRWLYIRNYNPHVSWNAPEHYSDQAPMRREIARLAREGKLNADQLSYAGPAKAAVEELYDVQADPHNVRNLAGDAAHASALGRMRKAMCEWTLRTRDSGFLPEEDLQQAGEKGSTPWQLAQDEKAYPLERVLEVAELVGRPEAVERQARLLEDELGAVRMWAARGLEAVGEKARPVLAELKRAMDDAQPSVRIAAAGAVLRLCDDAKAVGVLADALVPDQSYAIYAARTLELLGEKARPALPAVRKALQAKKQDRYLDYGLLDLVAELDKK